MMTTSQLDLVHSPEAAATLLHPLRARILGNLRTPDSAAGLARRLDVPRQKVNYHLRTLESAGLVELVEERRRGNCTERLLQASARSYLISPDVVGELGTEPEEVADRLSATYLVALAARVIRDVALQRRRAEEADRRLATLAVQSRVRFASAERQAAFADELGEAVTDLVARYHDEDAPGGRPFEVVVAAYPTVRRPPEEDP